MNISTRSLDYYEEAFIREHNARIMEVERRIDEVFTEIKNMLKKFRDDKGEFNEEVLIELKDEMYRIVNEKKELKRHFEIDGTI